MKNALKKLSLLILTTFLLVLAPSVFAQAVVCGETLVTSTTMTGDLLNCDSTHGLIINSSDITLDCAGFKIQSNQNASFTGIVLGSAADNAVIDNCEVENFRVGIGEVFGGSGLTCQKNITGVTIQNIVINASRVGLDLNTDCDSEPQKNLYFNDIILKNIDVFVIEYASEFEADGYLIDDFEMTCLGPVGGLFCQAGIWMDNVANGVANNIVSHSAFELAMPYGQGAVHLDMKNNVVNNSFLNVSGGNPITFAIQDMGGASDNVLIVQNIISVSDKPPGPVGDYAFVQIDNGETVIATDVVHPYQAAFISGGTYIRRFTSTIQTNIGNVDLDITSANGTIIQTSTNAQGTATQVLEAYNNTAPCCNTIVNSTPYDIDATKASFPDVLNNVFTSGDAGYGEPQFTSLDLQYLACGQVLPGDVTLTGDVLNCDSSDGLIINSSSLTLDCAGFKVNSSVSGGNFIGIVFSTAADDSIVSSCNVDNGFHYSYGFDFRHRTDGTNLTGFTLQNSNFFNSDFGGLVTQGASGPTAHVLDFTVRDVQGSMIFGGNGLEINGGSGILIENYNFTCESCSNGVQTQEVNNFIARNVIINKPSPSSDGAENGFLIQGFPTNAIALIVDFFFRGFGPVLLSENGNVTLRNGKVVSDSFAIIQEGSEDFTFVENVTYPISNLSQAVTGKIFRSWDSAVQTNIPNIDVVLTSNQAVVTNLNTGITGLVTLSLQEYELDSFLTKTDSAPYDVQASQDSPPEAFTGGAFTVGSALANLFFIDGFTIGLIFQGIASLAMMAALVFLILGFFTLMIKKGK